MGPGSPDWLALECEPRAEPVKAGYARTTWRVALGDRTVFAKVIDHGGFVGWLKRCTAADTARREWRALRQARSRGVSVVRSLAIGVDWGVSRRTVLITEGLPDAISLPDAWRQCVEQASGHERRATGSDLINAVARLFAVAHERGFVHDDAHPNNILMHSKPNGKLETSYVDVHSSWFARRPVSVRRSVESLTQLEQFFHRRATRTERLRFLRSYLSRRESMAQYWGEQWVDRAFLARLARAEISHARRLACRRDRRLRRCGKYFATFPLNDGWKATAALRLERRHVFPETDVPDRTEDDWCALLNPPARSLADGRAAVGAFDQSGLHVETNRLERLVERVSATCFGSAHWRVFERSHRMRHRDVPAELILAYAKHQRHGLIDATVLIRPTRVDTDSAKAVAHRLPGG